MDTEQLQLTFSKDTSVISSDWLNMEQAILDSKQESANYTDIYQMLVLARSGISASAYKRSSCSSIVFTSDGRIEIPIEFYVYPSRLDLPYSLSVNDGTISAKQEIEVYKEGNLIVKKSNEAELPFLVRVESYNYDIPVYNLNGVQISTPPISFIDNKFLFSSKIFTVLRLKCYAIGHKYTATLSYQKTVESVEKLKELANDQQSRITPSKGGSFGLSTIGIDSNFTGYFNAVNESENGNSSDSESTSTESESTIQFNTIKNPTVIVKAKYIDASDGEQKETELELKLPKCAIDLLSYCPNDGEIIYAGSVIDSTNQTATVYYSTCTGNVLAVNYE